MAVFTFPVFALTGPLAPATTVALFGQRYANSAVILSILALGYYVNVILGFDTYTLQVCGRVRYLVVVNMFTACLNIGLCFALAPARRSRRRGCRQLHRAGRPEPPRPGSTPAQHPDRLGGTLVLGVLRRDRGGRRRSVPLPMAGVAGIVVSRVAAAAGAALVLVLGSPALRLAETFPELQRLPIVRRVVR